MMKKFCLVATLALLAQLGNRGILAQPISAGAETPYYLLFAPDESQNQILSSYGRGYLIHRKNQILFARKDKRGQVIDVGESGRTVRRFVRI